MGDYYNDKRETMNVIRFRKNQRVAGVHYIGIDNNEYNKECRSMDCMCVEYVKAKKE